VCFSFSDNGDYELTYDKTKTKNVCTSLDHFADLGFFVLRKCNYELPLHYKRWRSILIIKITVRV